MKNPLLEYFSRAIGLTGPVELVITQNLTGRVERHVLNQPFALVGRAPQNDVVLEHTSISRRHAFLQVIGNRLLCVDLGSRTGLRWTDGPRRAGWLSVGEAFKLGEFELRLTECPAPAVVALEDADPLFARPAEPDELADFALEIDSGNGRPTIWPMLQWLALAGRGGACVIRAADQRLSPFHCAFVKTANQLFLIDLLSEGRTRVNGTVARAARLKDGDLVRVGAVSVVVQTGSNSPMGGEMVASLPPATVRMDQQMQSYQGYTLAESVTGVVAPIHEILRQFQECMTVMARMFTTLQQEQSALAREQMAELQRATRELRESRAELANSPFAEIVPMPMTPDVPATSGPSAPPVPKPLDPATVGDLADAHAWLMKRLGEMKEGIGKGAR